MQGGKVAQTHELRAFFNGFGDFFVRQLRQDARQAIAAAGQQGDVCAAFCRTRNGCDACGIVAREALLGGERIGIDLYRVAALLQAFDGTAKACKIAHCARWRINVDMCHDKNRKKRDELSAVFTNTARGQGATEESAPVAHSDNHAHAAVAIV